MTKITSLTKDQESKIPQYLQKWLDVGYRTKTIDREKAKDAVNFLYADILGMPFPKYYLFLDSPMACQLALNIIGNDKEFSQLYSQLDSQLRSQLNSQLNSQLGSQLDSQLNSQLGSQLRSQLYSQLYSQLGSQLDSQLRSQLNSQLNSQLDSQLYSQLGSQLNSQLNSQLRSQLGSQLNSQLGSQLNSQLDSQLNSQLDSQLDSQLRSQLYSQLYSQLEYRSETRSNWWNNFYWHYDYVLNELFPEKVKDFQKFVKYLDGSKEYHQIYLSPDFAIFSDFPSEINLNQEHRLHKDGGPALLYRDSYALYSLNGISVTKEIAELKPEEITKETILKQENADYRREIVRKLTGKQLLEVLDPQVLDEKFGYTLLSIDLGDDRKRPFLKMNNPSIEAVHVEGVIPSCKTVEDAICFRNGLKEFELPLTLDGFSLFTEEIGLYHQQGDLLLFPEEIPKDAKKCSHNIAGDGLIRHTLKNGEIYELNNVRYLGAFENARITHPEHKDTILQHGMSYRVAKTLEYDHWKEESREVID